MGIFEDEAAVGYGRILKMRKREEILSANSIKGTIPFSKSRSQILLLEVLLDVRELLIGLGADKALMAKAHKK